MIGYADAVAALDARTNYERTGRLTAPSLDRIAALVDMLAHPQRGYPVIHVTGTNGKTTAARAASEVLRAADLGVATYTSPHVSSIRERFTFDGVPISEAAFVDAWRELAPYLDHFDAQGMRITWFEAATALAFVWFADKATEAAVIEVGMGGSWDATNVVDADVAMFTEIGVDHRELGSTPEETAREKAGIIKAGSVAISVAQRPEVEAVLRARCDEVGAELRMEPDAFTIESVTLGVGGQQVVFGVGDDRYDVFLPMFGEQFARDAVLGVAAARALLGDASLAPEVVADGLGRLRVPGRMEVVHRHPLVVLDGAHNPGAARALADAMRSSFHWSRLLVVASVMQDKDIEAVLDPVLAIADEAIVTRNNSPRAAEPERLAEIARARNVDVTTVEDVADAVAVAIERAGDDDAVLVTGSLYTVGDARERFVG